jgi:hypothetical protein
MTPHTEKPGTQDELRRQADELYDQFGKPLEPEHLGEYLAIAPDGIGGMANAFEDEAISRHHRPVGEGQTTSADI